MTVKDNPSVVQQDVESANSPETIALRTSNNDVPDEVSAYNIAQARISETAAGAAVVRVQSYDDDNSQVEHETVVNVGANSTVEPGARDDNPLLTVRRGNQIRVVTDSDVEVTLYIVPDDL